MELRKRLLLGLVDRSEGEVHRFGRVPRAAVGPGHAVETLAESADRVAEVRGERTDDRSTNYATLE